MKNKILLFIGTILLLIACIVYNFYLEENTIFSNTVMNFQEVGAFIGNKKEYTDFIELFFNNTSIPYVNNNENSYFLLSQTDTKDYQGSISVKEKFNIHIIKPSKTKEEILKDNDNISILLYNKDYYKIVNLKITCLPVVSIYKEKQIEMDLFGKIVLFDPNGNGRENLYDIQKYHVKFHKRGSSSYDAPKSSYKLNIIDKNENKKKVSMLGMREDNDWVLNSISSDISYIREKLGYTIWDTLSSEYNHRIEYVEFVMDNQYKGIYYLQEPVDVKTFQGEKGDILLSIKDWRRHRNLYNADIIKYTDEMRKIDEIEFESGTFSEDLLENNIKRTHFLRNFVGLFEKTKFPNDIQIEYDLDNSANYELFVNLLLAVDNDYKNEKIYFRETEGKYIMLKTPWDLDLTMSNDGEIDRFHMNEILFDYSLSRSVADQTDYKKLLKEKYQKIKEEIYNEEMLNQYIETYKGILLNSGAIKRQMNNDIKPFLDSCETIKTFFKNRIVVLDHYYGGM